MGESGGNRSPYQQMKYKLGKKINEEVDDNKKQVRNAQGIANDLVEPETLERLKNIIIERPEVEPGLDWKLWFHIIRKTLTYVILKCVDIVTDFAASYQHFKRGDVKYGLLTLFFVYLPGFVLSCGFTYWGLCTKRGGDAPERKQITLERLGKYCLLLFLFPFLYPIVQIILGCLLVALLIRRRDQEPLKFMGHDLKQFKSLEGFLESGPQFVLQTYILLIGQKNKESINWKNITEDDAERLAVLSLSILMSFVSLVKTAYSVNVPDPDPRRRQPQYKKNARYFKLTLFLFKTFCVLFRTLSLSYFFVYLRDWTTILIITAFLSNIIILYCVDAVIIIILILGAISIFVPNGYLLYNFAGTIQVNLTREESRAYFLSSTLVVNLIWMAGVVAVAVLAETNELPDEHVIADKSTQYKFVMGMDVCLLAVGVISSILAVVHWFVSIEKLFEEPSDIQDEEVPVQLSSL